MLSGLALLLLVEFVVFSDITFFFLKNISALLLAIILPTQFFRQNVALTFILACLECNVTTDACGNQGVSD
jgi:uncharacterized membrane protein SirB2